jgi:hypothetical protein
MQVQADGLLESQQLNHMIASEGLPFACDSQHQRSKKESTEKLSLPYRLSGQNGQQRHRPLHSVHSANI